MSELTKEEKRWISSLRRLAARKPKHLRLYVTDSDLNVCKDGVSSNDIAEKVSLDIGSGCYLLDLHDDRPI